MVWRWLVATSLLLLPLVGCGGGGSPVTSPSVPTGSVEGRLVAMDSTTPKSRQVNIRFRARVHGLETQNAFALQIRTNGYFRIDNVPAGEQVISVEDETFQQGAVFVCLVRPGQVTNVGEIELSNLASISGTVTDPDGKPVARVRIVARPINSEDDTVEQLPARPFFTALTDENGNYKLLVPAGTYLVEARHPNYEPASQTVTVEESSSVTLDFQLTPQPRETGTVVGKVMAELNGTLIPVPGALVLLKPLYFEILPLSETVTEKTTVGQLISSQMSPSQQGLVPPGRPIRYRLFTFTKADGTFELIGVPAGTYTAIAYKPSYGQDTKTVEVKASETVRVEFSLRTYLGILKGQVTDASIGQPIEKALVFVVKWGDTWFGWENWEKSDNGKWVRPMAGGGKGGHRPTMCPVDPPTRAGTLTDSNGNYSLVLPAGNYFVVAVKEGYIAQGQQVTLMEGQTVQVNFALQPAASVE